jgi:hypothetical protein
VLLAFRFRRRLLRIAKDSTKGRTLTTPYRHCGLGDRRSGVGHELPRLPSETGGPIRVNIPRQQRSGQER